MQVIGLIILGLIVGVVAKLLMPGRDPGGFIVTILLGIAGSFIGGFVATYLHIATGWLGSFVMAVIGAMVLLLIYRLITRSTTAAG